jgi:hypothetical protein
VPLSWETSLAENALQQMDEGTLKPSKLPAERQAQLRARFDQLAQQTPPALQRYRGYAAAGSRWSFARAWAPMPLHCPAARW